MLQPDSQENLTNEVIVGECCTQNVERPRTTTLLFFVNNFWLVLGPLLFFLFQNNGEVEELDI